MTTIEPAIQEQILAILPDDGELAILLLAQLFANVVMSIDKIHIQAAMDMIMVNWNEYERNPI